MPLWTDQFGLRKRLLSGPNPCPRRWCWCTTCEDWRTARITPGIAARVWAPSEAMGAKQTYHTSTWKVGGPLEFGLTLAHDTLVCVVGWSRSERVDAHLDAVVVMRFVGQKMVLRSMLAHDLVPV